MIEVIFQNKAHYTKLLQQKAATMYYVVLKWIHL